MYKNLTIIIAVAAVGFGLVLLPGCENKAQTGALVGSGAGAGIGAIIGNQSGNAGAGALIGAAAGGLGGYVIGNEGDKKDTAAKTNAEMNSIRADVNSEIVNVNNSNGSVIQVRMNRQGVGWVGPRGEYYAALPTSDQLRPVYGF